MTRYGSATFLRTSLGAQVIPLLLIFALGAVAFGCSAAGEGNLAGEGIAGDQSDNTNAEGEGSLDGPEGEATCGDGTCDPGEHVFNCRPDCDPSPYLACLSAACTEHVQACSPSAACGDALVCISQCDPELDADAAAVCRGDCAANLVEADAEAFTAVLECEATSGCRPDGPPEVVEPTPEETSDPALSCADRCGEPANGDACACDASCVVFGDCCEDYEAECTEEEPGTGAPPAPAPATSCEARCGEPAAEEGGCACDAGCALFGDCCDDYEAFCGEDTVEPEPTDPCGDGVCSDDESSESCPADCDSVVEPAPGPEGVTGCLAEACPSEYEACIADEACVAVLECIEACPPGDQGCLFDCSQVGGFSMSAINLGVCGQGSGCFDAEPPGPGPGPGAECGNGMCEPGEGMNSCPEDCQPGFGDACTMENCGDEYFACMETEGCMEVYECLVACDSPDCADECVGQAAPQALQALQGLRICYEEACGGGPPPQGEGCIWEECGPQITGCLEDDGCEQLLYCIQDCESEACAQNCASQVDEEAIFLYNSAAECYVENCLEEGFCGDGVCGPGENPGNCPDDCGGGPGPGPGPGGGIAECLEDNCGNELQECMGDDGCMEALECIEGCPGGDQTCLFECSQVGGFSMAAINLGICGQGAGCFEGGGPGGPECGNGECEAGENQDNCPQDCGGGVEPGESLECIIETCGVADFCFGVDNCINALNCIAECGSAACVEACADAMEPGQGLGKNYVNNQIVPCVIDSDCLGGGGGGPVCGDGVCSPGEFCPEDCDDAPGELFGCLSDACPSQWDNCLDDDVCADALPCLNECVESGGTGCTYQCMPPNQENEALLELGMCGGANGCGNICGDGECDPGETPDSCPQDCQGGGGGGGGGDDNPGLQCLEDNCPGAVEDCNDTDCWSIFACYNECPDGAQGCYQECYFSASGGAQNASNEIGECWEDNDCANADGGGNGGGGNGGGGNGGDDEEYFECIEDACGSQLNTCYTNGSTTCPATFNCVEECLEDGGKTTDDCVNGCYDINNGSTSGTTTNLYECSASNCHNVEGGGNGGGGNGGGGGGNGGGGNGGNAGEPAEVVLQCLEGECPSELDSCYDSSTCSDVLDCALECGADFDCIFGCAQGNAFFDPAVIGIGTCLQTSGCLEEVGG